MKKDQSISETAAKGSAYNLASLIILKMGGLAFTVIIARLLLPELFGIYALALSIVTIAVTFTDFGLNTTFIRYSSESLAKKNKKEVRGYFEFFLKRKIVLIIISVIALASLSEYLSFEIYKNPIIYYPLIISCLFVISESFREFFSSIFVAKKDIKPTVFLDFLSQILKIALSIVAILIFSSEVKISFLFIAFFISSLVTLLFALLKLQKRHKEFFKGSSKKIDNSRVNKYWKYMALATLSLAFFGSIDTLMLGGFVSSEYLGYYRASLSLILSIAALFPLSSIFLPIFTQINKKRFERGFQKTIRYLLIISIPATLGIVFLAKYLIFLIYGNEYLPATSSVYFLSLLIITTPLISLYSTVLESKERPKRVSKAVIISLIANVIFNYTSIKIFSYDPLLVIAGVGFSTALSRIILLLILVYYSRKDLKLRVKGIGIRKPVISTIVMSLFLYAFNYYTDVSLFTGILEVFLGIFIYFTTLILMKGLNKEDWILVRDLVRKKK